MISEYMSNEYLSNDFLYDNVGFFIKMIDIYDNNDCDSFSYIYNYFLNEVIYLSSFLESDAYNVVDYMTTINNIKANSSLQFLEYTFNLFNNIYNYIHHIKTIFTTEGIIKLMKRYPDSLYTFVSTNAHILQENNLNNEYSNDYIDDFCKTLKFILQPITVKDIIDHPFLKEYSISSLLLLLILYKFLVQLYIAKEYAIFIVNFILENKDKKIIPQSHFTILKYSNILSLIGTENINIKELLNYSIYQSNEAVNDKIDNTMVKRHKKESEKMEKEETIFNNLISKIKLKTNDIIQKGKDIKKRLTGHYDFYKKYLGRIDGLFKFYADTAQIKENKLKGDPVKVLNNEAITYIRDIIVNSRTLYQELLLLSKSIASNDNIENILKQFAKFLDVNINELKESEKLDLKKMIYSRAIYKMGEVLLQNGNHEVYGYTLDSIKEDNKLPPPNHVIVSLFVVNPHEEPQLQSVSSIFDGPESFKIMNKNQQIDITKMVSMSSDELAKIGNSNDLKKVIEMQKINKLKITQFVRSHFNQSDKDERNKVNRYKRMIEHGWDGLIQAMKEFQNFKNYLIDVCSSYLNMVERIDNLCRMAIAEMLLIEKNNKDVRYEDNLKAGTYKEIEKNMQDKRDTKKDAISFTDKINMSDKENKIDRKQGNGNFDSNDNEIKRKLKEGANELKDYMKKNKFV